jgi:hypothetical protein
MVTGWAPTSSAMREVLRAVGAPLDALQVGAGVDRLGREDALRRPRHGEQHLEALLGQQPSSAGFCEACHSFLRLGVGGGEEGHVVGAEQRFSLA